MVPFHNLYSKQLNKAPTPLTSNIFKLNLSKYSQSREENRAPKFKTLEEISIGKLKKIKI